MCRAAEAVRTNPCCHEGVIGPFPHFDSAFLALSRSVVEALVTEVASSRRLADAERRVVAGNGRFREDIYSSALLFSAASGMLLTVANVSCEPVAPSVKVLKSQPSPRLKRSVLRAMS